MYNDRKTDPWTQMDRWMNIYRQTEKQKEERLPDKCSSLYKLALTRECSSKQKIRKKVEIKHFQCTAFK